MFGTKTSCRFFKFFSSLSVLLALACCSPFISAVSADELWLGGLVQWENRKATSIVDGPEMFQDGAPWRTVQKATNVVLIGPGNIDHATDAELQRVFAYLKEHNLALAIADGVLVKGPRCQAVNEAYGLPGALVFTMEKIRRNGGDLKYLRMDEPFFFGHKYSDPTSCHEPVSVIAQEVAKSVKLIRSYFPNVKIGDGEPVDNSGSESIAELERWTQAYQQAVGEPLAFFHADVVWSDMAMRDLAPLAKFLHSKHIPFGVVYNGDDRSSTTDLDWTKSAISHFVDIESGLQIHPEQAIIQTWSALPTKMLPERKPGTLTNIAFEYIKPPAFVSISNAGRRISGRVLDQQQNAVPGARIQVRALDVFGRLSPKVHQLVDVVPQNATSAIILIRINNEGCSAGEQAGTATLGTIRYAEKGTNAQQLVAPFAGVDQMRGSPGFNTFQITKDKTFGPNLKKISVTPGADFVLSAPMSVSASADSAGYVGMIFFDSQNKPIVRKFLRFTPTEEVLGDIKADDQGNFEFTLDDKIAQASPEIQIYFPGNGALRPALLRTTCNAR